MISELLAHIRKVTDINQQDEQLISAGFSPQRYKRNTELLRSGEVAHEAFFVLEGVLHQFYVDEAGNERTCNFAFGHEFITDLESFSSQTRSASSIKTLGAATCLVIRCKDLVLLLQQSPAMNIFFRNLVEQVAARSIRRTRSLLSFSPEKQFTELLEEYPEILQRVPQRYIAQYLGIAPESLSRIRRRMMEMAKS